MSNENEISKTDAVSEEYIFQIKARCELATPGPWRSYLESRDQIAGSDFIQTGGEDIYLYGATIADKEFIAHARQDIPRLVGEVLRLRGLLRESD
jgi:hypothetical protein